LFPTQPSLGHRFVLTSSDWADRAGPKEEGMIVAQDTSLEEKHTLTVTFELCGAFHELKKYSNPRVTLLTPNRV
jgi:hypothetical protein